MQIAEVSTLRMLERGFDEDHAPRLADGVVAFSPDQIEAGVAAGGVVAGDVAVQVQLSDHAVALQVIASIRVVDVDHLGCPTNAEPHVVPDRPAQAPLLPDDVSSAVLCAYHGFAPDAGLLQASTRLTGDRLAEVHAAVVEAEPGPNADLPPELCLIESEQVNTPNVVLHAKSPGGPTTVYISPSLCTGRGMDDGTYAAQLDDQIMATLTTAIHAGLASFVAYP